MKEIWCDDQQGGEGCSGVGRPSCTATECMFGVETCPECRKPKGVGVKCGYVHQPTEGSDLAENVL